MEMWYDDWEPIQANTEDLIDSSEEEKKSGLFFKIGFSIDAMQSLNDANKRIIKEFGIKHGDLVWVKVDAYVSATGNGLIFSGGDSIRHAASVIIDPNGEVVKTRISSEDEEVPELYGEPIHFSSKFSKSIMFQL